MTDYIEQWNPKTWQIDRVPLAGAGTCETENPHHHKMGVLPTQTGFALEEGLIADWFALTFPTGDEDQRTRVLEMLGALFPLVETTYGGNGYISGFSFLEGGRVLWHPEQLGMGVHLRMPSQCLAVVAELLPEWKNPLELLRTFVDTWGATATRSDLAIDTDQDIVTLAEKHLSRGDVVSRAKSWEERKPMLLTGEIKGHGVTIGSRSSETYVRIYHKGLEQGLGEEVDWYRAEYEFKKDRAHAVLEMLLAGDFEGVRSVMLGHLDFKIPNPSDDNKWRWASADWWLELLGTVTKRFLRLARAAEQSIDRLGKWLGRQAGPSLFVWRDYCRRKEIDFNTWVTSFAERSDHNPRLQLIMDTF